MKIRDEIKQSKFRNSLQEVSINLLYTAGWLANKHKDFFGHFNITSQQFNILSILRGQYPNSVSGAEIKSRMMDKNSDVSRLLDRLIIKELITKSKCSNDKRAADITISQKGLELLKSVDSHCAELDQIVSGLTDNEASQLSDLLDKVRG